MYVQSSLPQVYIDAITKDYRHYRFYCIYGGRGGGKTHGIAEALVLHMISQTERDMTYACLRETQKTLQDSTKAVIMGAIKRLKLDSFFHTSRTSDEVKCLLNGCLFKFRGIGTLIDIDKFKSIENVRFAWVDEAHALKEDIWEVFTPSVRRPDSQIIVTFNPRKKTDFMYENFVINPSRFSIVKKINYYDNPWFFDNHALVIEKEDCFERNQEKFNHIWLGGTTTGISQIFNPNWWNRYDNRSAAVAQCTASFITADTAYKTKQHNDYSVIQHWGYNRYQLYLLNQVRGKWAFPDLVRTFKKFTIESTRLASKCPPQRVYIEDKASGISLVQTLQVDGINAVPWKPKDFQFPEDKVGRAKEASLYIERRCVYIPTNEAADWARGFVNEHSDFDPEQDGFDDQVDAQTMAVSIYRERGGGIMADQIRN